MFNIKFKEKSYKMSFKALPVKLKWSKNRHGGRGWGGGWVPPLPPPGQTGLPKRF